MPKGPGPMASRASMRRIFLRALPVHAIGRGERASRSKATRRKRLTSALRALQAVENEIVNTRPLASKRLLAHEEASAEGAQAEGEAIAAPGSCKGCKG